MMELFKRRETKVFGVIWIILVLGIIFSKGMMETKNKIYQGNEINIELERENIEIEAMGDKVEIEGFSDCYFSLKKTDEEIIYSQSPNVPSGSFILPKIQIAEGKWTLTSLYSSSITSLKMTSADSITIVCSPNFESKLLVWTLNIFFGGMIGGLVGIILCSIIETRKKKP